MGLNLVIIGPPGSGKGTQAGRVAHDMGLAHLSTGDLLRKEVAAGTPIGVKVKTNMETGVLVPDEVMTELAASHVLKASRQGGFILDGYPRTVEQAQDLANLLAEHDVTLSGVVNITLPDGDIVDRLASRLTCPQCQRSYHAVSNPPRKAGACDACGTSLATRKDDNEAVIRHRIAVYWEQTAPVVEFCRGRGLVHDVDGTDGASAGGTRRSALA
jgi:adenylate kinase